MSRDAQRKGREVLVWFLVGASSGCGFATPYTIDKTVAAQAYVYQYQEGEDPARLALAARSQEASPDGMTTYLSAAALDLAPRKLLKGESLKVAVPKRSKHRVAGAVLLSLGLVSLAGISTVVAIDLGAKRGDFKGFASAFVGIGVGPLSLSTLITGGVLLRRGLNEPAEVAAGLPRVRYLDPRPGFAVSASDLALPRPADSRAVLLAPADGRAARGRVSAVGDGKITIEGEGVDEVRPHDCFLVCAAHGGCGRYVVSRAQRERDGSWLATATHQSGPTAREGDLAALANGSCR